MKHMRFAGRLLAVATLTFASFSVTAARAAEQTATPASTLSDGEVRRINKDANKLTLRHGPIENLGMPPMTMVFQVKDPAMLDRVTTGDKVKFFAEKIGGAYVVTRIESVK